MSGNIAEGNGSSINDADAQHRNLALLVYVLQGFGVFTGGLTWIAAMVVNYLKRSEVRDTWVESHFRWQLNTFWYGLLWLIVGTLFWIVFLGWFMWGLVTIWVVYRIIKGLLYLNDRKPIIF
ncbi:MAG: Uncharacterised protein [SAR92 bacterium MED-G29]|jgi:uncharacterized membrane protein|nr:MAG: Uncharacterised protein [SAR92 bacterium MED-G29]|tara:strand:+ start:33423 stop:33788 length:366 start_codon:yes stop_codon:yes gene_type:complete